MRQLVSDDVPANAAIPLSLAMRTLLRSPAYDANLAGALGIAEQQRTELASLAVARKLGDEAIITARAGYFPSVKAFAGYDAVSRVQARDPTDPLYGGLAGVQLSWAIFDGMFTAGRVQEARGRRD